MKIILSCLVAGFAAFGCPRVCAAGLTVAAAADLRFALEEVIREFHIHRPGTTVKVTYGSSGNFFAQIQSGAPVDLYLSADIEYPRKLAAAEYALDSNVFLYAVGRIVVWTQADSPVDVEKLGIQSLLDPRVKKIAVANPQHAPYGRAAVAAMKSFKVYEEAQPKLVFGDNIVQAAQFVQTGAADIGIIALSLVVAPQMRERARYWEVPPDAYPRIEQGGIILKRVREVQAARAFRDFLLGGRGREVLERYGFLLPEPL